jgi:hypothetical protein
MILHIEIARIHSPFRYVSNQWLYFPVHSPSVFRFDQSLPVDRPPDELNPKDITERRLRREQTHVNWVHNIMD